MFILEANVDFVNIKKREQLHTTFDICVRQAYNIGWQIDFCNFFFREVSFKTMKNDVDMLHGSLWKSILIYAIPVILTNYLQLLFNAADLVVVGRFSGSLSVAAVGATTAVTHLIINLFMGLSIGAGVAVANAIGCGNTGDVHRTVHTAMLASLVGGAVLSVIGVMGADWCLRMMRTPESVLPLACVYMQIYFAGMIFTMVYNFSTAILRAAGDTRSPMVILFAAGIINVVLNLIFVIVFRMNVAGVALATVISQAVSAAAVVAVMTRRQDAVRFQPSRMRCYSAQLRTIIRIGLPAGIQGSMFSISNTLIQSSMNSLGEAIVSANAAAANFEGFCYVTVNSFHQTAMNFIGQNRGAHRFDRVKSTFGISILYGCLAGALIGGLGYLFRDLILRIYITDSPEAIAAGGLRMMITTLPYFVYGMLEVITGALRGIGGSFSSMVLSVLGICGLRVLWISTAFRVYHTPVCLYMSYPISWSISLVAQLTAFLIIYRKVRQDSVQ